MKPNRKLKHFDPDGVGNKNNTIFGLPFDTTDARLVFIPVPWDVTVTNDSGTAGGPDNIFNHSFQIDHFDPLVPMAWKEGIAMEETDPFIVSRNRQMRKVAERVIHHLEHGGATDDDPGIRQMIEQVNAACEKLMLDIEMRAIQYLQNGQLPVLVGGDHSVSTGLIRALAKQEDFGILQIDAHADFRIAYQGFTHSHASVIYNALHTQGVTQIVQAGIREVSQEEVMMISGNPGVVTAFFDHELHQRMFEGETWESICREIIGKLPDNIYVTFDVDGLAPALCPGTGTPLPGGLSFNQAIYLLETAFKMGKRFVGADLVETGITKLDGIVASRLLYRLAGMIIKSNTLNK